MKLTHIRDLIAVVKTGSLRAASRHLGIAQPVITRSIRQLEKELGVSLLDRHSKGVSPTPVGALFVRRMEAVEAEIKRASDEVAQHQGKDIGEVSCALSPLACMTLLPPAIRTFNRLYPNSVIKITQSLFHAVEQSLADGLHDFWVGSVDPKEVSPRFAVERLIPHSRRVAARKDHPLIGASSIEELAGARWVRPSVDDRNIESDVEALFSKLGLPTPQLSVHSSYTLITLITVANTDLLTVLPEQIFQLMPIAQFCVPLENIAPIPADPIVLIYRHGLPLTPFATKACDLIRKSAKNYALANGLEWLSDT